MDTQKQLHPERLQVRRSAHTVKKNTSTRSKSRSNAKRKKSSVSMSQPISTVNTENAQNVLMRSLSAIRCHFKDFYIRIALYFMLLVMVVLAIYFFLQSLIVAIFTHKYVR